MLRLNFADITGKSYGQADIAAHKATVFLFLSAQCPLFTAIAILALSSLFTCDGYLCVHCQARLHQTTKLYNSDS